MRGRPPVCTSVLDHEAPVEGQVDPIHASLPQRGASRRLTPRVVPADDATVDAELGCAHGAVHNVKQRPLKDFGAHQKRSAVIRSRAGLKKKTTCASRHSQLLALPASITSTGSSKLQRLLAARLIEEGLAVEGVVLKAEPGALHLPTKPLALSPRCARLCLRSMQALASHAPTV